MSVQPCGVFSGLDAEHQDLLFSRFTRRALAKGEALAREGEPAERFLVVMDGEIHLIKNIGLARREVGRLGPGDCFGELALVSEHEWSLTLRAATPSEVLEIERAGFQRLLNEDALFARHMLGILIGRLSQAAETIEHESLATHEKLLLSLGRLAETCDPDAHGHLCRTREYCRFIAERLAERSDFQSVVTPDFIETLYAVAPLHDIGKVVIPGNILMKAGKLTAEEFAVVKTHTVAGAESVRLARELSDREPLRIAHRMTLWHHESFDGKGYPEGIYGEQIPLEARIMAIADVFDALISRRVYKPPYGRDEIYWAIQQLAGRKFDPRIAQVVLANLQGLEAIARRFV